jgi:hypothetical protein
MHAAISAASEVDSDNINLSVGFESFCIADSSCHYLSSNSRSCLAVFCRKSGSSVKKLRSSLLLSVGSEVTHSSVSQAPSSSLNLSLRISAIAF